MKSERPIIGFYCLVFGLYWRIQLKRPNRWRDMFFYALTINFLLSTAYFVILIIQVQFKITVSRISMLRCIEKLFPIWATFNWFSNSQRNVLKTHSFKSADEWLAIANDALYTCIDFISQLVLVSILDLQIFLDYNNIFEALPMLDNVASTIGYGLPVHFIICVFRC